MERVLWHAAVIYGPPLLVAAWVSEIIRRARVRVSKAFVMSLGKLYTTRSPVKLIASIVAVPSYQFRWLAEQTRSIDAGVTLVAASSHEALLKEARTALRQCCLSAWEPREEICVAAVRNDVGTLKRLLATSNLFTGDFDVPPLHYAILWGREDALRLLAERTDVNACDRKGRTALHWAARVGWRQAIELLIERGAWVGTRDYDLKTPLHYAVETGQIKVAETLLRHGSNLHAADSEGKTPLHYAAELRNEKLVELLLDYGANPWIRDSESKTPLDYADLPLRTLMEDLWRWKQWQQQLYSSGP